MPLSFNSRPALIAYLTSGDPDLATTREVALAAVRAGAEIIELGVPFSDPVADGVVIQRASERALRKGVSLGQVLDLAREIRSQTDAGLIIFSYFNPIFRMGLEEFASRTHEAGADGALITDLPVEEAGEYLRHMRRQKLATVFLAAPTSTSERLERVAQSSSGFVYAVSRTGVTGARKNLENDARQLVERLRKLTRLPIAVGFGISEASQVQSVAQFADAAVVGSAIVDRIERHPGKEARAVAEFIQQLLSRVRLQSAAVQ